MKYLSKSPLRTGPSMPALVSYLRIHPFCLSEGLLRTRGAQVTHMRDFMRRSTNRNAKPGKLLCDIFCWDIAGINQNL